MNARARRRHAATLATAATLAIVAGLLVTAPAESHGLHDRELVRQLLRGEVDATGVRPARCESRFVGDEARRCLGLLVALGKAGTKAYEKALLRWVERQAAAGLLSPLAVDRLVGGDASPHPLLAELSRLLTGSLDEPVLWSATPERQRAAAAALGAAASRHLDARDPAAARRAARAALDLAPEATAARVLLELSHRDEAPEPELLDRVVGVLEERRRDLPLAARFDLHYELGRAWAAREAWTRAIDDLERARDVAPDLPSRDARLPQVHLLLARAHRASGHRAAAVRASLDGTAAFLDADALDDAATALAELDGGTVDSAAALAAILTTRLRLRAEEDATGDVPALTGDEPPWLAARAETTLPESFLRRQRFKVFADLSRLAARAEQWRESRRLAAAAIAAIGTTRHLTSPGDALRLRELGQRTLAEGWVDPAGAVVTSAGPVDGERTRRWSVPVGGGRSVEVALSDALLIAMRDAVEVAGDAPPGTVRARVRWRRLIAD